MLSDIQSLIDLPFTAKDVSEDTASMSLMGSSEEDGSDSGKSRGSSGSLLTLHTSRLLPTSILLSLLVLSFFPDASAEIDEDDEEDEGEQCHSLSFESQ